MQVDTHALIGQFAADFVASFRELEKVKEIAAPSTRQSIAIARLLSAKYIKNRELLEADFVDAAVVTSYPRVQKIAEEIAKDTIRKLAKQNTSN
ncbi:MAG: hypothetical protein ABSF44_11900 [Candidatus Bathyarchaeia archaeon]